ncbi:hypothetical protein BGZ65_008602, partial [Modicella reniformis]
MNLIDQSLDDIIKAKTKRKGQRKLKVEETKVAKGVLKAVKTGRVAKRRTNVQKEAPLFTETYKVLAAPVKEIFTSRYIPLPTGSIKLIAINTKARKARKAATTATATATAASFSGS